MVRIHWEGFPSSDDVHNYPLPSFLAESKGKKASSDDNVLLLPIKDVAKVGYKWKAIKGTAGAFARVPGVGKLKITDAAKSRLKKWWKGIVERGGAKNMFRAFDAENDAWYAASAVVASSKVTSKKRKRGASGNENSGRKGNNGMSDYEKQRMQRIAENQKMLAEIGVESFSKVSSSIMASEFAARGSPNPESARPQKRRRTTKSRFASAPLAQRSSRRLKGLPADGKRKSARNASRNSSRPDDAESRAEEAKRLEKEREKSLLSKWKKHASAAIAPTGKRRLFLIPSGPPGVNDHTLYEPVPALKSHTWGFCEGLYKRIFLHVRPGDVLLFTSAGSGKFNLVGEVTECRVVSKAESDKFWRRMSYSMGGAAKSNVGFPLLTLVKPPVAVDWPKMDVMRLLGYTDHLQTSRYIRDAHKSEGGRAVLGRCLDALASTK